MSKPSKNPLVSINIPVYKCEKFILRCLESVKNQSYTNFEIILINDCTPDNSVNIIKEFINKNNQINIKLINHETNLGLSVVRNTGIVNSMGDFIYFLDSDDDIDIDCIKLLVENQLKTNAQLILSQNRWINTFDHSTKDFGFPTNSDDKYYNNNNTIFKAYCEDRFPITSWNKLINLEFIKKNQIYFIPGLYAQDELWMFHLMEKIDTLSIIDNITYNYYLHGESVIFNRTRKNFENYITILNYFEKSFKNSESTIRKKLIKKKIIHFRNMVMVMQWKAMRNDLEYFKLNYKKMKKLPSLNISEYFSNDFDIKTKKLNFFQNLPTIIGVRLFIKRFG